MKDYKYIVRQLCFFILILSFPTIMVPQDVGLTLKKGRTWVYDFHHFEDRSTETQIVYDETVIPVSYTIAGSWGRFSDHFFDKKELNDVAIFK